MRGVTIGDLGSNRYHFKFYHALDIQRAVEGSPWTFDRQLLLLHVLAEGEDPMTVHVNKTLFWVQIHDLLVSFRLKRVCKDIGNGLGTYVNSDPKKFSNIWQPYMRVQYAHDVFHPILTGTTIKKKGTLGSLVKFRYEKIPTVCFICGLFGHNEKVCNLVFDNPEKEFTKIPNPIIRALIKCQRQMSISQQWLREEGSKSGGERTKQGDDMAVDGSLRLGGHAVNGKNLTRVNGAKKSGIGIMHVEEGSSMHGNDIVKAWLM